MYLRFEHLHVIETTHGKIVRPKEPACETKNIHTYNLDPLQVRQRTVHQEEAFVEITQSWDGDDFNHFYEPICL